MRHLKYIFFLVALLFFNPLHAGESDDAPENKVNVKDIIFGHIGDSYEWHITNWGEKEYVIHLPVILYSKESGWHIFMSSALAHGSEYNGFYIAKYGDYAGKVVSRNLAGDEVRPFDISITKNVFALFINSLLLVIIILAVAHWYKNKKPESGAPRGFVGLMEMMIMMIHDDVIKSCVGKDYKRFAPYLLTAFFFIFLNNIMGLIPIFPGGANITGNISITLVLALFTFLMVNLFGTKEYWKDIFWPHVPTWLKVPVPLMPLVELFGVLTKPFALMIRLFANIMAGHSVILALTAIIFMTVSMGPAINGTMTFVSVIFNIFMNLLELLVAFIQAYVFTMLSAVFIGLARVGSKEADCCDEK